MPTKAEKVSNCGSPKECKKAKKTKKKALRGLKKEKKAKKVKKSKGKDLSGESKDFSNKANFEKEDEISRPVPDGFTDFFSFSIINCIYFHNVIVRKKMTYLNKNKTEKKK